MMQGSTNKTAVSPSWTWGSSASLLLTADTPLDATNTGVALSSQLAQVSLPEPAVCTLFIQARLITQYPTDSVQRLVLNLSEGIGRVTVPRQVTFAFQPAINAPLEFTLPFVPVHALQVDVQAYILNISQQPDTRVQVETYFVISPLTRIPQAEQKLAFGMDLPGEADDLDNEMVAELEAEGPSVQQSILNGMPQPEGDDDDDDDDGDDVQGAPAWLLQVVDNLHRRLGREPTRNELAHVVRRIQSRARRRLVRSRA